MKVINTLTPEIIGFTRNRKPDGLSIRAYGVFFTKGFCMKNGFKAGDLIEFIQDGSNWRFCLTSTESGFVLTGNKRKDGSLGIYNQGLCRLMRYSTGIEGSVFCKIIKTSNEKGAKPIFEVLTSKPLPTTNKKR